MSTAETNTLSTSRSLLSVRGVRSSVLAVLAGFSLAVPAIAQTENPETKPGDAKAAAPSDPKVNKLDLPYDNMGINKDDPNATVVYAVKVRGEVGTDFGATPLQQILKDAQRIQPDVIVFDIDSTFRPTQQGATETYSPNDANRAFNAVDTIAEMSKLIIEGVRDNPQWKKKPKVVAWVRNAIGPAAFLPYVCQEIYYTPEARHGGIGFLDLVFAGVGDEVVREKQRSLRLGRGEGLAVKGGHDHRILRAMARRDYVLSYTMVGGKPEFHEDMSGDTILTDDGDPDAGRADSVEDIIRGKGNDVLTLTTPVAKRIGFIDGEAATFDDLMFELGASRAFVVYGRRSERIISDWRRMVDNVVPQLQKLDRDRREWRLEGDTSAARNQSRSRLKRIYNQMIDLVARNKEVAMAAGIGGEPDDLINNFREEIAVIDQQIRLDRDR